MSSDIIKHLKLNRRDSQILNLESATLWDYYVTCENDTRVPKAMCKVSVNLRYVA